MGEWVAQTIPKPLDCHHMREVVMAKSSYNFYSAIPNYKQNQSIQANFF